jgi:hypothetical protein
MSSFVLALANSCPTEAPNRNPTALMSVPTVEEQDITGIGAGSDKTQNNSSRAPSNVLRLGQKGMRAEIASGNHRVVSPLTFMDTVAAPLSPRGDQRRIGITFPATLNGK